MKSLLQELTVLIFRPLISREVSGWGKLYATFVGDARRNDFWRSARRRLAQDKRTQFFSEFDLANESDRYTFFLRRWYDLPLQILLEKALKPGDEVVDVGAHVGLFSLAARRVVGAEGLIHAFEPNPLPCQRLQQAIALNRLENIKVYSVGLGEQTGQQSLYFSPQNSGVGSLQPPVDDAAAAEMEEILVDMQRGDEILPSAAPRLIKLDVEGAEMAAMRGCAHLIHQHLPLIIYEFIPTQAQQFNYAFRDLFALAQQHDYQIFKVELVYADGQYDLQLSPITTPDYSDSGDLLLGHIQDPFIQSMAADS